MRLVIKEGRFSSLNDLFITFTYNDSVFYTLPKDGEGRHAKWEQVFVLDVPERVAEI